MEKISAEQEREVLKEAAVTLRRVTAERDEALNKLAAREKRDRAVKLAAAMIDKGLETGSVREVADRLEKQAHEGSLDLSVTEKAVELFGPNMGKTASVSDLHSAAGASDLERFIAS